MTQEPDNSHPQKSPDALQFDIGNIENNTGTAIGNNINQSVSHVTNHITTIVPQWLAILMAVLAGLSAMLIALFAMDILPSAPPAESQTAQVTDTEKCSYAVTVRDIETGQPIHRAKLTLDYKLDSYIEYTNSDGRHRDTFTCDEPNPRYDLRIVVDGYRAYHTEFTVQDASEIIYLVPTATRFCPYVISVLDRDTLVRIANAKVRVEVGLYHVTAFTNSEGDYVSSVPCDEAEPSGASLASPSQLVTVWVYADGYVTYNGSLPLGDEIQEVRLVAESNIDQ
ncbi:MAG: hypothetical protein AAF639_30130 [Chloroflexota bacterium]